MSVTSKSEPTVQDINQLLQENEQFRSLLPLCPQCGVPPEVQVQHSQHTDHVIVAVACHGKGATRDVAGLEFHKRIDVNGKLDVLLRVIGDTLRFDILGETQPPPTMPKPRVRARLYRKDAPWNF